MKLRELPMGSRIMFGSDKSTDYAADRKASMIWRKVSNDGLLLMELSIDAKVDLPHPDGATVKERTTGSCYFPDTLLFKFLNASDTWASDETVRTMIPWQNHYAEKGFLSWFSETERSVMKQWDMPIIPPKRLRKKLGDVVNIPTLVGIPAIGEYAVNNDDSELYRNSEDHEVRIVRRHPRDVNQVVHTRSSVGESICSIGSSSRSATPKAPNVDALVYPIICLDTDLQVERAMDVWGMRGEVWCMILPETERGKLIEEINSLYGW